MKRNILLLCCAFLSSVLMAQVSDSMYLEGLKLHLEFLASDHKGNKVDTYFVESDNQITKDLPSTINGHNVCYLDKAAIKKKGKQNQFNLIVIRPIEIKENSVLEINIIDYQVAFKKRRYNYANAGGSKLLYKFDCNSERYVLKDKLQGGI